MVEVKALSREVERMLTPDIVSATRRIVDKAIKKVAYAKTVERVIDAIEDLFRSIPQCDLNVIIEKYETTLNTIDSTKRTLEKASSMTFIPKEIADEITAALNEIQDRLDDNIKGIYSNIC
jgi:hypothetical protein